MQTRTSPPCETPAASGPPGLHTTTRELQTCTFDSPGASNTTKIPRADPRKTKRAKMGRERDKKVRHFGLPTLRGPTLRGPHPSGHTDCETTKTHMLAKNGLAKIGLAKIGLAKIGFGQNWIGQNWSNKDGQKRIGQKRSLHRRHPRRHPRRDFQVRGGGLEIESENERREGGFKRERGFKGFFCADEH